ncbi:hypothetical protein VTI28DRAFT_702 [Corynascus sepedonium]
MSLRIVRRRNRRVVDREAIFAPHSRFCTRVSQRHHRERFQTVTGSTESKGTLGPRLGRRLSDLLFCAVTVRCSEWFDEASSGTIIHFQTTTAGTSPGRFMRAFPPPTAATPTLTTQSRNSMSGRKVPPTSFPSLHQPVRACWHFRILTTNNILSMLWPLNCCILHLIYKPSNPTPDANPFSHMARDVLALTLAINSRQPRFTASPSPMRNSLSVSQSRQPQCFSSRRTTHRRARIYTELFDACVSCVVRPSAFC